MSSKNKPKKVFESGFLYRIVNYKTDKHYTLEIKDRKGKWVTILLDGILKEVRVYPVTNPFSESILLDDYSPVYSYNFLTNGQEQLYEY